jgi:hypothetical protein
LSLEPVFCRGYGSLYKALDRGGIDTDRLRRLLVTHLPDPGVGPRVFAVDASTWDRCDAETSPERGFYYSASKHSAGQPIVAGWNYQWINQLCFTPDSWTAPADVTRITAADTHTDATVAQIRQLFTFLPDEQHAPMFEFDAGYDPGRDRSRPRQHQCPDPVPHPRRPRLPHRCTTTPEPAPNHRRSPATPRTPLLLRRASLLAMTDSDTRRAGPTLRHDQRHRLGRTTPTTRRPHPQDPLAVVVRARHPRPRPVLARLPTPVRHRAHLPVRQEHPRLDHPVATHPRPSRPLELAHRRRLHPTTPRPQLRCRSPTSLGTPLATSQLTPHRVRRGFRALAATLGTPANPPQPSRAGPGRTKGTGGAPVRLPAFSRGLVAGSVVR